MPYGLRSSKSIHFLAEVTERKEETNMKPRFRFVCVIHKRMLHELHPHYAKKKEKEKKKKKKLFPPQIFPSSLELLNKMFYFTWLITGIVLIYPRSDILNHIFFSIEGNEMIFIFRHDWLFGSWSQKSIRVQSIAPTSW